MKIISPTKRQKGIYKFVIKEDVVYRDSGLQLEFDSEWLSIQMNGDIVIKGRNKDGYAWDGCSPKFNVLDLFLIGTPDGRVNLSTGKSVTYYASLLHDALYQYKSQIGLDRKTADDLFLVYMGDFKLRYLYYYGVRILGGLYELFKRN